jgi:hypothetical protein
VDIKGAAELPVTPSRNERRDLARDAPQEREVSPGVRVEIGRPPDLPGTYNARGVVDGAPALLKNAPSPAVPGPATPVAERAPIEKMPTPLSPGTPEALRVPANAQVQNLANASPQMAASLRPTIPMEAAHLHPPPLALTAGIQTLASNALKQAEKGNAAAEHEDDADPLREEKEPPAREGNRARQR